LDLRQKIQELQTRLDSKLEDGNRRFTDENSQMRRSLQELQNQIEVNTAEIAKLRGQNEQLLRDLSEIQRQQKDATQSVDDRLRRVEPIRVSVDGREFMADPTEKRDYDAAIAIFRKADYVQAKQGFVDFINRYPQSGYRPTALFWLGNAQYVNKDYKEAINSFRTLMALGSDHPRIPEAALAVANCQLELKDTKAARKTWEDLIANYPKSEAAQAAKERLARLR
jgi:tol-pal system protein YbgF